MNTAVGLMRLLRNDGDYSMREKKINAYLDTNTLMHYQKLDQIPWCELLQADHVTLILTPLIFDELEKNRFVENPITRERAKTAIKEIRKILGDQDECEINETVILKAPIEGFPASPVDLISDNELLDSVLKYSSKDEKVLITNDFNLRRRAKSRGISVLELNEKYERSFKDDAQTRKITKLTTEKEELAGELEEIKNREPKLDLYFDDDTNEKTYIVKNPTYYESTFRNFKEAEESGSKTHFDWPALNKQLQEAREKSTLKIFTKLQNVGSSPANDIKIKLGLPLQPKKFNTLIPARSKRSIYAIETFVDHIEVQMNLDKLRHTETILLPVIDILVADWDDTNRIVSFNIEYRLIADNIQPIDGILNVNIERDESL